MRNSVKILKKSISKFSRTLLGSQIIHMADYFLKHYLSFYSLSNRFASGNDVKVLKS